MNIIRRKTKLEESLHVLDSFTLIANDTETTGKNPYHGDRLFSMILATPDDEYYYDFSFGGLSRRLLKEFTPLFSNKDKQFCFVNAKFDLAMLRNDSLEIKGKIIDCPSIARVENNLHTGVRVGDGESLLSLDYLAKHYLGRDKDSTVETYIKEKGLYKIDGMGEKAPAYDQVPLDIIAPYGCMDGRLTFDICVEIYKRLNEKGLLEVAGAEIDLTPVLFRMKNHGMKVNMPYTEKAFNHSITKADEMQEEVQKELGESFNLNSPKQVGEYVVSKGVSLPKNEKSGRYKSDKDTLEKYASNLPVIAKIIKSKKERKKANTYYKNFIKFKDSNDILHCNINQETAITGRCSSSSPNLQNLHKEENPTPNDYYVRRSFLPVIGNLFFFDYRQQEMVVMVDQAEEMRVIDRMKAGEDFYNSTAQVIKEITGREFTRKIAKAVALGVAYGQGNALLAKNLGITVSEAKAIRRALFKGLPKLQKLQERLEFSVKTRGYIKNVYGRILKIPRAKAYKALNAYVQGSSADVTKRALILCDARIAHLKSKLCLQVHDEIVVDIFPGEEAEVIEIIKTAMSEVYKFKHIPLRVDVEYSPNGGSWVDKIDYN